MGTGYFDDLVDPHYGYVFLGANVVALIAWLLSLIEKNSSQVDRIWPIMPAVYSWAYYIVALKNKGFGLMGNSLTRLTIVCVLLTLSSARLTWVFWRKGYYEWHHEDARWTRIRENFSPVAFFLFNFFFICVFQNWVLFSLNSPVWFIVQNSQANNPINLIDVACILLFAFFFVYETVADYQQQQFQAAKREWLRSQQSGQSSKRIYTSTEAEDFNRGFLVRGLFKYSRHPNYVGEIGLWWSLYLFSVASQYPSMKHDFTVKTLFNWSIIPILFFTLVFQMTTLATERASSEKYPEYASYKSRVSKILPWFKGYDPKSVIRGTDSQP